MKNKNRPFFYEKKKTSFGKVLAIVLITTIILLFAGFQIPGIRQIISEPLFAAGSYVWNAAKDFFDMTRMYREPEQKKKTYAPLELPDQQVLFAESLENLSSITQDDPLADLRQTPTPSEYSRVAQWEYQDPNLNYAISSGERAIDDTIRIQLIPPVFEHADLFNDGPAILSAYFRYWNITENQYHIAETTHPNSTDPVTSFADLENYVINNYPDFMTVRHLNGDKEILVNLLRQDIPVIVLVMDRFPYSFWINDDRCKGSYYLILGYDGQREVFSYQDSSKGNTLEISEDDLLADWYPFQREYMIIYPESKDEAVREALSENYYEELNYQRALTKFRTDSELLSEDPYAQYNCAVLLHRDGDNGGAWSLFEKAMELGLPQHYVGYQTDMLRTALELGYADDLEALTSPLLRRNANDELLTVYRGWAEIIRGEYKKGSDFFEKANKINPNSSEVRYALKYRDTMLNY